MWLAQWKHRYYILSWAQKTWFHILPQVYATETLQLPAWHYPEVASVVCPSYLTCCCLHRSFGEYLQKHKWELATWFHWVLTAFKCWPVLPMSCIFLTAYDLQPFYAVFLFRGANSLSTPFPKEWPQGLSKDFAVKFPSSSCHFNLLYEVGYITNLFLRKIEHFLSLLVRWGLAGSDFGWWMQRKWDT